MTLARSRGREVLMVIVAVVCCGFEELKASDVEPRYRIYLQRPQSDLFFKNVASEK
jgi:hypothetical protein